MKSEQNMIASSTRAMIHAAAPCPIHTKQAMIEWWGNSIWEYYAATEGGGTVVDADSWSKFPGTVGKHGQVLKLKLLTIMGLKLNRMIKVQSL